MSKATIAAVVVVVAVIVAGVGIYFLLLGPSEQPSAGLPKVLTTADGRKTLGAAKQETSAESMAKTQFCAAHPDKPEANVSVSVATDNIGENMDYWVTTVTCDDVSETYWVPQEVDKPERMTVGQSLTYRISGSVTSMGQSFSMSGTLSCSIPQMVTYQGVQCFKVDISYNVTSMGTTVSMTGYMYVDSDYKPRYMSMTMGMGVLGTMTITADYDYAAGTMTMTYDGASTEVPITGDVFNQQYLNSFVGEELYVGWSDTYSFGYGSGAQSTAYSMTITCVDEELVTVPAGTFRCYKLVASMPAMEGVQLTMTMYTNAQMTLVPKMTMDMQITMLGQTASTSMTMELESYSGF